MKMFDMEFLEACKTATRKAYEGKFAPADIESLLEKMPVPANNETGLETPALTGITVPSPIHAKASIYSAVFYASVNCAPKHAPHNAWTFEGDAWGPGLAAGGAEGFMYTAYDSYEALFANTKAFHAQGVAGAIGVFQINWFNADGVPIGQFNGALVGGGAFEVGGKGGWHKK